MSNWLSDYEEQGYFFPVPDQLSPGSNLQGLDWQLRSHGLDSTTFYNFVRPEV